jgi:hypothetical protein
MCLNLYLEHCILISKGTISYSVKENLEMKNKTRICQSVIATILLCRSECWPTQEKHVSRITATEMRCYRKIVGKTKTDRVRNERIGEQVGQESVRRVLEERQLR